ncbi:MAG: hypothetical protein LQ345_005184 [Seirophora villosa]|nr:MAG: hypothetical protein LQ345_005184 [Seirophora villosa]
MGKKRKQLSHEEIWDDSALVDSWDAALQEYQLYHSIHARGERVEDVLKEVEASEQSLPTQEQQAGQTSPPIVHGLPDQEDLEDGEVEDEDGRNELSAAAGAKVEPVQNGEEIVEQQHGVPSATPGSVPHNMPGTLMHGSKIHHAQRTHL